MKDRVVLITNVEHFAGPPAAFLLASRGATVACHDKSFSTETAREAYSNRNPGPQAFAEQDPESLVQAVTDTLGKIDVVVSNDSFPAIRAPIDAADIDDLRSGLEEMVVAPFALAKAAVPQMKERRSGKILFITSAVPFHGLPNYSMYVTARGATNAMAVSLAKELGPHNVQVNAIAPNYVENPDYFPEELRQNEQAMSKILKSIPLRRLGKPEEIAALIAFYASDDSDFITGNVMPFAGGWA
jgi:NAD(P)-dependent dehydrogenase (short-subunit alcohol dehydrogenase family)|tara:strand:- start:430 stop:1158 length:729 start_codon:yes stop_codon:yes gene_type:complete